MFNQHHNYLFIIIYLQKYRTINHYIYIDHTFYQHFLRRSLYEVPHCSNLKDKIMTKLDTTSFIDVMSFNSHLTARSGFKAIFIFSYTAGLIASWALNRFLLQSLLLLRNLDGLDGMSLLRAKFSNVLSR